MKSQAVRVVDVALLAPLLLWTASRRELPPWARLFFGVSGAATLVYNGRNFLELEELGEVLELDPNAQTIRLLDIFALGPAMLWAADELEGVAPLPRLGLGLGGALTIANNARNFVELGRV